MLLKGIDGNAAHSAPSAGAAERKQEWDNQVGRVVEPATYWPAVAAVGAARRAHSGLLPTMGH
jgi:hypothetical protein